MIPGGGRPEPPASLDPIEARIWRDVIDALPGFGSNCRVNWSCGGSVMSGGVRRAPGTAHSRIITRRFGAADEQLTALAASTVRRPRRSLTCWPNCAPRLARAWCRGMLASSRAGASRNRARGKSGPEMETSSSDVVGQNSLPGLRR